MNNSWLSRFAAFVAVCAVYVLLSGAALTNLSSGPAGSGAAAPNSVDIPAAFSAIGHRISAEGVTLLVAILAIWTAVSKARKFVQNLAWIALAGVILEALLGIRALPDSSGFLHAFVAPVILGAITLIAAFTSPLWRGDPHHVPDHGWPSVRGLANSTVYLMLLQVALGAAFRHDLASVLWHIGGALLVILLILGLVMCVMQAPNGEFLRPYAIVLVSLAGFQTMLGLTVISMGATGKHQQFTLVTTVMHTVTGALTLASAVLLTALVRRNVVRTAKAPA